jgi:hypothetical protein
LGLLAGLYQDLWKPLVFDDPQTMQQKKMLLAECNSYTKKVETLIEKTNTEQLNFVKQPIFQQPSFVNKNNPNPTFPFGLVLSRNEINSLIRDTIDLKFKILTHYSSSKVFRVLENLIKIIDHPWILDLVILFQTEGGGEFEEKGAKTKEQVKKIKSLLSSLYLSMQDELLNKNLSSVQNSSSSLYVDLRELRYGVDIDILQDLELLIEKATNNSKTDNDKNDSNEVVEVFLIKNPYKNIEFITAEQNSKYIYSINTEKLSKGDKYLILAIIKPFVKEVTTTWVIINEDGVWEKNQDDSNFMGWVFTPPKRPIEKDKLWVAIWE